MKESLSFSANREPYILVNREAEADCHFLSRFKSLSVQERINALSTTFPFFVTKLVDAHNELRETSVLSQFRRNLHVPPYATSGAVGL